ncbi:MAG TPA: chorismate mutase [Bacteroidales bacterium]|nr:chorismate mutase [Bacteroidales bacterium]
MTPEPQLLLHNEWWPVSGRPLIISGPCSAESEHQVLETARLLAATGKVDVFRSGVWKPRTRPGGFEGVGEPALFWLKKVKEETGMLTTVEVASPLHIEQALNHGIDILWVGARTVVNPFSMEELAQALQGVDVPVLVKNPLTPDLKLWMGALERINKAGINKIAAIHRGFHYFQKSPYRNAPMWEIPIELKRLLPQLPVITDISHICGRRDILQEIAQKAIDLETNGLMIESHIDPQNAKTDAAQQVTPAELVQLLSALVLRVPNGSPVFEYMLEKLRTEIDKIDGELLQLLARRMDIVDEIGHYKLQNNITILQLKRWQHIIDDRMSIGLHLGLDEKFLMQILELVHEASINRQQQIFRIEGQASPAAET